MTKSLSVHVSLVAVLACLGIGLAVLGTTIGIGGGSPDADTNRITVDDRTVTVSIGDEETVAIGDLSGVSTVEVSTHGDHVTIETEGQFEEKEYDRAIEIAESNETIQQTIDVESYDFTAEPIEKLSSERSSNVSIENGSEFKIGTNATYSMSIDEDNRNDSVTVDRDPEYVAGVLSVNVIDPHTDERRFSVRVDLHNETVTSLTDWDE